MAARVISQARRPAGGSTLPVANPYAPAKGIEAAGTIISCVALGLVLPYLVHTFGASPRVLLPMHFPIFLAGVLLNPIHAALVGIFAPSLSMALSGMPTPEQAIRMMPELSTYAVITSLMLRSLPRVPLASDRWARVFAIAIAMMVAMICGRLVYVAMHGWLTGLESASYYLSVLVVPAMVGLIAQILIVPLVSYKIQKIMNR